MLTRILCLLPLALGVPATAAAQDAGLEVQAGFGYAHVFGGGGPSLTASVQRRLNSAGRAVQHGVGGGLWFANTEIATLPQEAGGRDLAGIGVRYQLNLRRCCWGVHPVLAVPFQVLHSSTPETFLPDASVFRAIPEPPGAPPDEDRTSAWGWGTGLEIGLQVPLGARWAAQSTILGLYQDIYQSSTAHGAWTWHLGVTYGFGRR